jgi:hypothetical protein
MAPESSSTELDVFLEYRLTSMLLSLVATMVATIGNSRLKYSNYEPPLENTQSSAARALNALAAILVRDAEVVAVTYFDPSSDSPLSWDSPNTFEVLVMQEGMGTMVPHSDPPTPVQRPWLTIIQPGQSKWGEITASPWCCTSKP